MVVEKHPGVDAECPGLAEGSQPRQEILSIFITPKDGGPFDPPAHHMM